MPDRVTRAVREAQAILARYVDPSSRDSEKTINDLLTVLDDERLVQAMDEDETVLSGLGASSARLCDGTLLCSSLGLA